MAWQGKTCQLEAELTDALDAAQIAFTRQDTGPTHLDFHLTDYGVYLEVKRFHTARVEEQMQRAPNVIVVQGPQASQFMAGLLRGVMKEKRAGEKAHG
jgi:hypothetical protein